ncbi:MAG: lysophospholipase [Proteobacteria bacterium]|nr:lysophospholipase [Pseudomonadota bacterium]
MTRLVILPGTDGTGALLGEFVAALGDLKSFVVSYPTDQILDYEQLVDLIQPQLPPSGPYFLLGESFGGPLAVLLAADQRSSCAGVILCASFARYASPLRALAPLASFVPVARIPACVMSWFLLGWWSTPRLQIQLTNALNQVSPTVLRARIRAALRINVMPQLKTLNMPLLYLQASHDRIIPASSGRNIAASVPSAILTRVTGPHFLLQAAPQACATEVRRFIGC